jgi:hypothetical protein
MTGETDAFPLPQDFRPASSALPQLADFTIVKRINSINNTVTRVFLALDVKNENRLVVLNAIVKKRKACLRTAVVCRERTFYPQEELELLASIILLHRNR